MYVIVFDTGLTRAWHHAMRYQLTEEDAKRTLIDPERIDYGALTVDPVALAPSGTWISGLVRSGPVRPRAVLPLGLRDAAPPGHREAWPPRD